MSGLTVELFLPADAARMNEAIALRFEVFVDEQGVPNDKEIDSYDREGSVQALARDGAGRAVATGRYFVRDGEIAQIGRMAVRRAVRGCGAGRAVLDALLSHARAAGLRTASLAAQLHAIGFYERSGFRRIGEQFSDAGILHVEMTRSI